MWEILMRINKNLVIVLPQVVPWGKLLLIE
jgi:hypothetical protein